METARTAGTAQRVPRGHTPGSQMGIPRKSRFELPNTPKGNDTFEVPPDSDASALRSCLRQWFNLLGARRSQVSGRITNATRLPPASVVECSFHPFVTQQRDDGSTYKQGAGVAMPVHTRGATPIIRRPLWLCREPSHLPEMH